MLRGLLRRLFREELGGAGRSAIVGAVIAASIFIGAYAVVGGGGAPAGTANLWIDTNGGTCTRSSSSVSYVDASACGSLSAAVSAATSGDTIQMVDGYYACETISGNTKTLTVRSDGSGTTAGNVPWFACTSSSYALRLSDSHNMTFDNVYIAGLQTCGACNNGGERHLTSNITLTNTHITCADDGSHFQVDTDGHCSAGLENGGDSLTMTGGEVGPTTEGVGDTQGGSHTWGDSTTFTGVTFDTNRCGVATGEGCHSEQLLVWSGNPLTITKSYFIGWSGTAAIYFSEFGTTGASNVLIENNFIGQGTGGGNYAIFIGTLTAAGGTNNFDIRYNTIYNGIYSDLAGQSGSTIIGNVSGYSAECPSGFTIDYNVWGDDAGRSCGTHSQTEVGSIPYVCDACHFDLSTGHLTSGALALGAAKPGDFPATDREGVSRPQGAAADAGAHESSLG